MAQSRTDLKTSNVSKLLSSIQLTSLCHKVTGSLCRGWTCKFPWPVCSHGFKVFNAYDFRFRRTLILRTKHKQIQGRPRTGWRRENRAQKGTAVLGQSKRTRVQSFNAPFNPCVQGLDGGSGSSRAGCRWKLLVKQPSVSGEAIKFGK